MKDLLNELLDELAEDYRQAVEWFNRVTGIRIGSPTDSKSLRRRQ